METFHWHNQNSRRPFLALLVAAALVAGAAWALPSREPRRAGRGASLPFRLSAPPPAFSGAITDRVGAGGYLYVRVNDTWVVTLDKPLPAGARVQVTPFGSAATFFSERLQRSFSPLVFAVVRPATG